jgi:DNA-binding NarL/FixJ family response regulator
MLDILAAEADPRFASRLRLLLSSSGLCVRFANSGAAALAALERQRPDAFLVGLSLPDSQGEELIGVARKLYAELPIIVLSVVEAAPRIVNSIKAGANGYLLKCDVATRLVPALRGLDKGAVALSDRAARVVLDALQAQDGKNAGQGETRERTLSPREIQVLEMLAHGYTYSDCATALDMSVNTLRTHVRTIYKKLAINSRTEAVREAVRRGLVE